MPAYAPEQLSDTDLDLLVRWMTKDYTPTGVADYESQLAAFGAATAAPATAETSAAAPATADAAVSDAPKAEEKAPEAAAEAEKK